MRLMLAAAIASTSAALTALAITSPASADAKAYALSGFTKIEAKAGFRIAFTQSPTWSVKVDSRYNNLDKIIVEKVGDTLRISRPEGFCTMRISRDGATASQNNGCLGHEIDDVITISAPDLEALDLNAAVKFTAPKLDVDKLSIGGRAAVSVDIDDLRVGKLNLDMEAASKFNAAGTCSHVVMTLGAATTVDAKGLKCREADVDAGVASKVQVFASDRAVANASISSSVLVSGNPRDFQKSTARFSSTVELAD